MKNPFHYFDSSPEVIRLVVMMYARFPLSLRNVEDLLAERGIDICHETVRLWWNRFGRHCQSKIYTGKFGWRGLSVSLILQKKSGPVTNGCRPHLAFTQLL